MAKRLQFSITGPERIHCESCEQRIGRALRRLPGVEDVEASAKEQRVSVSINPARTSADDVQTKLHELGYEVKPAEAA